MLAATIRAVLPVVPLTASILALESGQKLSRISPGTHNPCSLPVQSVSHSGSQHLLKMSHSIGLTHNARCKNRSGSDSVAAP